MPAPALAARITTGTGDPLPNAVVTVMAPDGTGHRVIRPDADGAIALTALDAGTYTVVATAPGHHPVARVALVSTTPVSLGHIALARDGAAPTPPAGRWDIDLGHSSIEISVRHLGIATVRGRFAKFSGTIEVAADAGASQVTATIDTASIHTDNDVRDEHLRSESFFDVGHYPSAQFRADGVAPSGDNWTLSGALTLRGVAVPIALDLTYLGEVDDPWGQRRAGFRASTTLRRNDFGISFDDKLLSGVAQMGATADVTLDIQAVLATT